MTEPHIYLDGFFFTKSKLSVDKLVFVCQRRIRSVKELRIS